MDKRNILDKRPIRLEDVMKEGYIPFLGGRPDRTTVITGDEILNLAISLNLCSSVDEFLKSIE